MSRYASRRYAMKKESAKRKEAAMTSCLKKFFFEEESRANRELEKTVAMFQ